MKDNNKLLKVEEKAFLEVVNPFATIKKVIKKKGTKVCNKYIIGNEYSIGFAYTAWTTQERTAIAIAFIDAGLFGSGVVFKDKYSNKRQAVLC